MLPIKHCIPDAIKYDQLQTDKSSLIKKLNKAYTPALMNLILILIRYYLTNN